MRQVYMGVVPIDGTRREEPGTGSPQACVGPAYRPPACTTPVFGDVSCTSIYAAWVNELAARGVVGGCGNGNYCPTAPVTREQMAVFLLRTLDPTAPAPPACTSRPFADVDPSSAFCRYIADLARRGITSGCGGGNDCPAASVTREQMAAFLVTTFSLRYP